MKELRGNSRIPYDDPRRVEARARAAARGITPSAPRSTAPRTAPPVVEQRAATKSHTGTGYHGGQLIDKQADAIHERISAMHERQALAASVELDAILRANPKAAAKLGGYAPLAPTIAAAADERGIHREWDSRQRAYDTYLRSGTESRDLAASSGSGAYLVPAGFMPSVLRGLKFANALLSRARIWESTSGAPASFPVAGADVSITGAQIAENTQVSESDIAFTQVSFGSSPLYVMKGLIRVGRALLQDEKVNLPALISDVMSARLARQLDTDLMTTLLAGGFGTTTTLSATAVTFVDIAAWVDSLDAVYRYSPNSAMIVSPATAAIIRAMTDTAARPLTLDTPYFSAPFDNSTAGGTDPDAQSLRFPSLLNLPILESAAVANIGATNVVGIAGDFSRAFVVRVPQDAFSILRLEERYAEFGQVGFVGYARVDGAVGLTAAAQLLKCHA
jgi:HK97 family phage major capsid protein